MNIFMYIKVKATGWQQQSLMYINEHIYVYKRTYFITSGT